MITILRVLLDLFTKLLTSVVEPLSKAIGVAVPILNSGIGDLLFTLIFSYIIVSDLLDFAKWYRREGLGKAIGFSLAVVVLQALAVIAFWYLPIRIYPRLTPTVTPEFMRWLLLFAASIFWFMNTRRNSGYRGVLTYLAHLAVFLLGWQFGQWVGILIISIPLLLASYVAVYYIALAIVPAADPDAPFLSFKAYSGLFRDLYSIFEKFFNSSPKELFQKDIPAFAKKLASAVASMGGEKWKRFLIFVWYLWGIQYPHLVIADTFGQRMEERIPGTPFGSGAPGLIWCKSNQVVGLTTGPSFGRVAGPGVVFTQRFERAVQIANSSNRISGSNLELVGCVDLRTQFRSIPFEAVSKDGHPFRAILFASFAIDRQEEWPRAEYHRLQQANPILKTGRICDQGKGIYRYNAARVQAALSTTAINNFASASDANTVHWDTWVLNRLCEGARQILSQRNLDELWRPRFDGPGKTPSMRLEVR